MTLKNKIRKVTVSQMKVAYEEYSKGTNYVILLHGWGQSHAFWRDLVERLTPKYHLFILDLPGFGLSQEPPKVWNLWDYAELIHKFIMKMGIKNDVVIIGHSFGGRIASVYATLYPVNKLVLYSNGGLPAISLKIKLNKYIIVPIAKHLFPNLLYKSHTLIFKPKEYKNNVLVNTKRSRRMLDIYTQPFQNLEDVFKKMKVTTLIIVGQKDFIASPIIGRTIHKLIKNSSLVEIPNATHFAHIEAADVFCEALEEFMYKK